MAPSARLGCFVKWPRWLSFHVITKLMFAAFNQGLGLGLKAANRAILCKIQALSVLKVAMTVYKGKIRFFDRYC